MLDFPRSSRKMTLLSNNDNYIHLFPPGLVDIIVIQINFVASSWCRLWDEALWYKSRCYSFHCSVDVYSMIVNVYSYCDITWNFSRKFAYSLRFHYLVSCDVSRVFCCIFLPTDLNDLFFFKHFSATHLHKTCRTKKLFETSLRER